MYHEIRRLVEDNDLDGAIKLLKKSAPGSYGNKMILLGQRFSALLSGKVMGTINDTYADTERNSITIAILTYTDEIWGRDVTPPPPRSRAEALSNETQMEIFAFFLTQATALSDIIKEISRTHPDLYSEGMGVLHDIADWEINKATSLVYDLDNSVQDTIRRKVREYVKKVNEAKRDNKTNLQESVLALISNGVPSWENIEIASKKLAGRNVRNEVLAKLLEVKDDDDDSRAYAAALIEKMITKL